MPFDMVDSFLDAVDSAVLEISPEVSAKSLKTAVYPLALHSRLVGLGGGSGNPLTLPLPPGGEGPTI